MVGTDYSQKSIEFAHRVAASRVPPIEPPIEFVHYDIMSPLPAPSSPHSPHPLLTPPNASGYDVVLDKGTFDAVSLSSDPLPGSFGRKRLCEGYKERILPLVKEGGVFVVTSCNWTEEELRGWFEGRGKGDGEEGEEGEWQLVFETAIKYRSFRFGGREGQSISSVCFRKRKRRR
jgi:EEF1A lysine methyltransferase 2